MTDEELIKSLRWKAGAYAKEAADRIEALTEQLAAAQQDAKEAEAYAGELEADRKKTYEALLKVSRIHGEVEAKLAKAAEALGMIANIELTFLDECRDIARTTLAEIKGESHE